MAGSILSRAGVDPVYSSLGRFGFGSLGLLVFMLRVRPWPRPDRATWLRLAAMGVLGVVFYNIFFFSGLKSVPPGRASLMASLQPSLIFLYSRFAWGDRFTPQKLLGLLLSLIGAALVLTQGDPLRLFSTGLGEGDLWILAAVLSWAVYTILGRGLTGKVEPLSATAYSIWIGFAILLSWTFVSGARVPDLTIASHWGLIAYVGLLGTTLAFLLFLRGLEQIGPARTSIFMNLIPIFSVLTSNLVLAEPVTIPTIAGGALALSGVRLLTRT